MSTTLGPGAITSRYEASSATPTASASSAVPWYLTTVVVAAALTYFGVLWDISWHSTIGRDTLWSPPHLCTYAAGLLVGVACGWVALRTTFAGSAEERARSVSVWGFRAPLGAWMCSWGAVAMLTSAPFDDWWHGAYGLDVKIVSPPHTLLSLGMIGIVVGALVMAVAWQNRASEGTGRRQLENYVLTVLGIMLGMVAIYTYEYSIRIYQHDAGFYKVSAIAYPMVLVAAARVSTRRWPATTVAAVYMASRLLMGWIFPLFPAEPKLGPIYNPVDQMIPMQFPLLLIAPAIGIDLFMRRFGRDASPGRDWVNALVLGVAFVVLFVAAQWPFASFLQSPASRNPIFWTDLFPYSVPAWTFSRRNVFLTQGGVQHLLVGLAMAMGYAALSSRLGLAWGRWMRQVQR